MNKLSDFPWRSIQQLRKSGLADQIRHMRTDHMYTENIIGLLVGHYFDEAVPTAVY